MQLRFTFLSRVGCKIYSGSSPLNSYIYTISYKNYVKIIIQHSSYWNFLCKNIQI